jgi:hypothetical protein
MGSRSLENELLLVGSLPVDSTEAAFRSASELFGDLVFALPDGETGPRAAWVGYERERLVRPNSAVETVEETDSPTGIPRHAYETPVFRVRDGVADLRWDTWPRIDDALESYRTFRRLRDDGVIPRHLRFQIGLPFPSSALNGFKVDFSHDYAIAAPAFADLFARELDRLLAEIPAEDLAIQWDVCYEVLDIEGVVTWMGDGDDAWNRYTDAVAALTHRIPDDVLVGYHLCYGTFPEWPMYEARDMRTLVRMANHAVANSGRRVDWLHLAGPRYLRSEDDGFFAPLADLDIGDTRPFLGIVLPLDGVPGLQRRHATARKYLPEFGVAMYCGFGRQPGRDGAETMRDHREAVLSVSRNARSRP